MNERRARWIALALLGVAVLVAVVALVLPNVLLRSDFLRKRINKDPDSGWLEYDAASSRWPGTLHVRNFRFRDRDPKAEWAMSLDEADVTYSLGDLLRRRFHVTSLSGRGGVFRVRSRLTPAEAKSKTLVSRLPPIAGFSDPPLLGPPERKPPRSGKVWTIQIDRLAIDDLREVWVEGYRCTGESRLTGGFFLRPEQRAEIFPSKLGIRRGTIRSGKDVIAADVAATFDARFDPWNPRELPGSKVLAVLFGGAQATARLDDAEIVNRLLGEPAGTRFERGSGRMTVRASVEGGVVAGSIAYEARDLALRALDVSMRGRFDGRLELSGIRMENWGGGRLNGGHVSLTDGTALDRDGSRYPWWARVDFSSGEFRPKTAALFTTKATARARNAQPLLQIAGVDLPGWADRFLRLDEAMTGRADVRVGNSLLELRRLAARTGKVEIFGDYAARNRARNGTFLVDAGLLSVGIGTGTGEKQVRIFGPRKWFRERTGWEPEKD
ncbi:MAG TPA: hypothetical protein VK392_10700 [Thermoanaerobaculia bacterium]|nr:hypothetical protein [Thermoanaerobaculia bacterium]